jgi:dipeptidyl aminopeptidase/acylaminoacyl peptidase
MGSCGENQPLEVDDEAGTGTLIVSNQTTGGGFDLDGYWVSVDGRDPVWIGVNEQVTVADRDLSEGGYNVLLDGIAENCAAMTTTQDVDVANETVTHVTFEVSCDPPPWLEAIRIAFVRMSYYGSATLTVMNADGSGALELVSAPSIYSPRVSPDGSRIAYLRSSDPFGFEEYRAPDDLYVMNADGSGVRLLAEAAGDPIWSPDGSRIAYTKGGLISPGVPLLHVQDVDGTDSQELWSGPSWGPRWSPDGTEIAVAVDDPFFVHPLFDDAWRSVIRVISADGSRTAQLTSVVTNDSEPSWSPDGSMVAFMRDGSLELPGRWSSIWVVDREGASERRLSDGAWPLWSPVSSRIAYEGLNEGVSDGIKIANPDGSGLAPLHEIPGRPRDWSPDGRLLLFEGPGPDVYLLNVEDGSVVRLTGDGEGYFPVFLPTGG